MRKILIVDDSATIRRMVMASLKSLKEVSFDEAGNGLEAIERLAIHPIHLIILDLNMPDMHGLEVLQFVRKHQAFRAIPILVLTTKADENSRSQALACGATRYMTKPFDPRALAQHAVELLSDADE